MFYTLFFKLILNNMLLIKIINYKKYKDQNSIIIYKKYQQLIK